MEMQHGVAWARLRSRAYHHRRCTTALACLPALQTSLLKPSDVAGWHLASNWQFSRPWPKAFARILCCQDSSSSGLRRHILKLDARCLSIWSLEV